MKGTKIFLICNYCKISSDSCKLLKFYQIQKRNKSNLSKFISQVKEHIGSTETLFYKVAFLHLFVFLYEWMIE